MSARPPARPAKPALPARPAPPGLADFSAVERRLIARLRYAARAFSGFSIACPTTKNRDGRATLSSFRGVVRHGCAHCLEAALFAAVVLEQHGYPPLVLSFESADALDHVVFLYRQHSGWGSIARSRDPGLHGRKPVFATPRALALSYFDPYIDFTGRITGYAVVDVAAEMGEYDWRLADTNVWKVERMLLDYPHRRIASSDARVDAPARQISRVPRRARRPETAVLQAARTMERSSAGKLVKIGDLMIW